MNKIQNKNVKFIIKSLQADNADAISNSFKSKIQSKFTNAIR
jgi:hypothetical protein